MQGLNYVAHMWSSEVQRVIRVCGSEVENEVYCGKHLLGMFTYSV